jgi:hypothetical protein
MFEYSNLEYRQTGQFEYLAQLELVFG